MIKYKVFLQSYSHDLRPLRNLFSRFHVKPGLRSTVGKHSVKFPNCSSFIFWILPVAVQWVLRRLRAASFVIVVVSALMSTLCSLKIRNVNSFQLDAQVEWPNSRIFIDIRNTWVYTDHLWFLVASLIHQGCDVKAGFPAAILAIHVGFGVFGAAP